MTESVSRINIPLMTINASKVSVINAMTAKVAPSERDQTSPIKTCAGWILNQRKAIMAQAIMRQSAERI